MDDKFRLFRIVDRVGEAGRPEEIKKINKCSKRLLHLVDDSASANRTGKLIG